MAATTNTASLAPQLPLPSLLLQLLLVSVLQLNLSLGQYSYPQPYQYGQPIYPYSGVSVVNQQPQQWLTNNVSPYPNPWQQTSSTYPYPVGIKQQPAQWSSPIINGPIPQRIAGEDTDLDFNTNLNLNSNVRHPGFLAAVMKNLRGIIDEKGNLINQPSQQQLIPVQMPRLR